MVRQEASNNQFPAAVIIVLSKLISICGVLWRSVCRGGEVVKSSVGSVTPAVGLRLMSRLLD